MTKEEIKTRRDYLVMVFDLLSKSERTLNDYTRIFNVDGFVHDILENVTALRVLVNGVINALDGFRVENGPGTAQRPPGPVVEGQMPDEPLRAGRARAGRIVLNDVDMRMDRAFEDVMRQREPAPREEEF